MIEDNNNDFKTSVKNLEKYEKRLSSLWWNFWRGIVYGFGFFVGSAIFAAIVVYILSRYVSWGWIDNLVKISGQG